MSGRYEDAMFYQAQHLSFVRSQAGRKYLMGFQGDFDEKRPYKVPDVKGFLPLMMEQTLLQADPIYVSDDVTTMIETAVKTFKPEPILPSDPFTQAGFAYMPRSIEARDRRGNLCGIRAMMWLPISQVPGGEPHAIWLAWLSHWTDVSGDEQRALSPEFVRRFPSAELQLLHYTHLPFNLGFENSGVGQDKVQTNQDADREMWAFPQVMWRLGQQLVPGKERAARPWRREAKRYGLNEELTVIRLRRSRHPDYEGEESNVEWSHRWLVRGHWRNQWYPSLQTHRQLWINPFLKGPEDKPLKVTDRVFDFVR